MIRRSAASKKILTDAPSSQVERLSFIEARLYFLGELRRQDVTSRFAVASVQASRDISVYKQLAPKNLVYDYRGKIYLPSDRFKRVFGLSTESVLWWLKSGLGDGVPHPQGFDAEAIPNLSIPASEQLAKVTRAIYRKKLLRINYLSLSSGEKSRLIAPHALVDTGLRWHVRAYDRNNCRFSDFVINRITDAQLLSDEMDVHESSENDEQWHCMVSLTLVPHPQIKHPASVMADYAMTDGRIQINCRAAMVGYFLRRWNIDATEEYSLNPAVHHLALANPKELEGVLSACLAPGPVQARAAND